MKINQPSPIQQKGLSSRNKRGSQKSDSAFEDLMTGGTEQTAASSDTSPVYAMDSLIGLQELSDDESSRKQAARYGNDLLDRLEALRLGLLMGAIPERQLLQLRHVLDQQKADVQDEKLLRLLEEIEIRAEVELAKLEKLP